MVAIVVLSSCGSDDKPCPPPSLVCVSSQEEADRKNADLDPSCHIYHFCDGGLDATNEGD